MEERESDETFAFSTSDEEEGLSAHKGEETTLFIVIDNFRLDQWEDIGVLVNSLFQPQRGKDTLYSILPTTTAFAGMLCSPVWCQWDMARLYPNFLGRWRFGMKAKNNFEEDWIRINLEKNRLPIKFSYNQNHPVVPRQSCIGAISHLFTKWAKCIGYNFVDMVSHCTDGHEDDSRTSTRWSCLPFTYHELVWSIPRYSNFWKKYMLLVRK